MSETLNVLPMSFWVGVFLLVYGSICATKWVGTGIGLPMLMVFGTVAAWYMGDAFYNDYANHHAKLFKADVLDNAWWQVAWFLGTFIVLAPILHKKYNAPYLHRSSYAYQMFQRGIDQPLFQQHLNTLFNGCLTVWFVLALIAIVRLQGESLHYFLPFLTYKADPWGRGRIGGGIDALLSLAGYLQMFVAACFGLVAALIRDRRVRFIAILLCVLLWPFYILDRARNIMLAVIMPAILAWVFLRIKGNLITKLAILVLCFLPINRWMKFVTTNRSTMSITSAFMQKGLSLQEDPDARQEGLNMFEELCWINTLLRDGSFNPSWGERYLAEITNPIPRSLWPGKPVIGIDYAIARGQLSATGEGGVAATISSGMIGQGVANFREVLGPAFAAFLMSFWAVLLARLDLHGELVGRLPLFALGLFLTYNLGRDITLITLYTFCFGWVIVWWLDRSSRPPVRKLQPMQGKRQRTSLQLNTVPYRTTGADQRPRTKHK